MSDLEGAWWHHEPVLRRFVSDVVAAQMALLRPTGYATPASPFDATVSLTRDLGVDSLEMSAVAGALNEALHLHESGIEDRLLMRPTVGEWVATAMEGLDAFSSVVTFRTSGSTGPRQRCAHSLADLQEEVTELCALLAGRQRVLAAVRSHHIYGFLFTVLLPHALRLGESAVIDVRQSLPSSVLSRMRPGDLVIGYPDFWRSIAALQARIPQGVVGVTSTAPCPDSIGHDLEQSGLEALLQVYGSTETAGVGVRTSPDSPYSLFSFWRRSATSVGDIVRVSRDGRHTTRPLQDVLDWVDDRHFRPTGRIDDVVQVAGVNVSLHAVRRTLLAHPAVRDAAVRLMSNESLSRLKAFVVPYDTDIDRRRLQGELEEWVKERLGALERPRAFSFGGALPVDAIGKSIDWGLDTIRDPIHQ